KLTRGVLAVTNEGISFLIWDASKARYESALKIPVDDVRSVTTSESWRGRGTMIVGERQGKDPQTRGIGTAPQYSGIEGFLITSARGVGDIESTEKALEVLKSLTTK